MTVSLPWIFSIVSLVNSQASVATDNANVATAMAPTAADVTINPRAENGILSYCTLLYVIVSLSLRVSLIDDY